MSANGCDQKKNHNESKKGRNDMKKGMKGSVTAFFVLCVVLSFTVSFSAGAFSSSSSSAPKASPVKWWKLPVSTVQASCVPSRTSCSP